METIINIYTKKKGVLRDWPLSSSLLFILRISDREWLVDLKSNKKYIRVFIETAVIGFR